MDMERGRLMLPLVIVMVMDTPIDPRAGGGQHLVLGERHPLHNFGLCYWGGATLELGVCHVPGDGVALKQAGVVRTLEGRDLAERELFEKSVGLVCLSEDKLVVNFDVGFAHLSNRQNLLGTEVAGVGKERA